MLAQALLHPRTLDLRSWGGGGLGVSVTLCWLGVAFAHAAAAREGQNKLDPHFFDEPWRALQGSQGQPEGARKGRGKG